MFAALPIPAPGTRTGDLNETPLSFASLGGGSQFTPRETEGIMHRIHARGDRIVARFLLLHALLALALAFAHGTWFISTITTAAALGMFAISLWLLPGSALTRMIAGLSLQTFVALHIYQMHGLAEMHFFFFTGTTVLIVYQDTRCFWLGALAIVLQHLSFALLHNSGVRVFFFEQNYVGVMKLVFHFGIVLGQAGICSYWAYLLKRQTLESTWKNRQLAQANQKLRDEMNERRQVEEALEQAQDDYHRVSANVPGMVYQFCRRKDGEYTFPYISEACREIFGVEPLQGMQDASAILSRIHPDDAETLVRSIEHSAAELTPWEWEGRLVGDGESKWVRGSSRPAARPNDSVVWDGVLIDVSDSKRGEVALRAAKEEAERANQAKSEFISRMSHELRTPLNAILGFGQLLERRRLAAREAEGVGHILKAGKHLLGLINEVLEISRIESGHMELSLEPVEVGPLVDEVLTLVKPLARSRSIALRVTRLPGEFHVRADLQRLKQVLLNLLSNAIKYNHDAGSVTISWSSIEPPPGASPAYGSWLRLSVIDTGRGIASDKQHLLFLPFERLGLENEGIEGSGIGLALSKRLVETMQGFVGVQSAEGAGSTFYLDLPMAQAPLGASALAEVAAEWQPPLLPDDAVEPIILQIEDNEANRKVIEHVLDMRGHVRLLSAHQGGIGLDLARQHRPDLILLDLNLPDLSGAEVLTRLAAEPETAGIPVIILSADATAGQIQRLLALGATDYLTKPIDIARLLDVIEEALRTPVRI